MTEAYLTIDDSPSDSTDALVDLLERRQIPALLFVRGDRLEANPGPVIRAIERGCLIGNHTFSHPRASTLSAEAMMADIGRCEHLIEQAYKSAGRTRSHKTFRFSYLDRGAGAWVVDFDRYGPDVRAVLQKLFWEGLNFCDTGRPPEADFEKMARLQSYLAREGYQIPFQGPMPDWVAQTEIGQAHDCFFTYSTSDWMLTRRHLAKNWPYKTLADLKAKIDDDAILRHSTARQIILAHDQDEIADPVCALLEYLLQKGFQFQRF